MALLKTLAALALALPIAANAAPSPPDPACRVGAYALEGGGHLTVWSQGKGRLGYLLPDGEQGSLGPMDAGVYSNAPAAPTAMLTFAGCAPNVTLSARGKPNRTAKRIGFQEQVLAFRAGDMMLSGKLVTPVGRSVRKVAIYVDGSDENPAVDSTYWQYELPLRGIGVFVLDKRGTGASTGATTSNFHLRAADVAAAVQEVRAKMGSKVDIGLIGLSQGGWVAPLSASKRPVDFVVVGYGMAEGVTDEDRQEIIQNLQAAGFGPADIKEAVELQTAAAAVAKSHWTSGYERFDELKAKYANARWINALGKDGFTALMVTTPSSLFRDLGPKMDQGISFEYEPRPVIAALRTRQLWVLGGSDTNAPSATTVEILTTLQQSNSGLAVAVFPKADHGIVETTLVDGVSHVRLSAGYLDLVAGWIKNGRIPPTPSARVQPAGGN